MSSNSHDSENEIFRPPPSELSRTPVRPLNIPKNKSSQPRPRITLPFLNLNLPETDTLIYVCSDTRTPPLRCSSQKLLATGSSRFEKWLNPTYQFRIQRRKNFLKLGLPMGIKFVVDLSPPTEGEEAVEAVEYFWCPDEILDWRSNLDGNYIEIDQSPPQSPRPKPASPDTLPIYIRDKMESELNAFHEKLIKRVRREAPLEEKPVAKQEVKTKKPAYLLARHTGAIERVLHILHGLDPQISTAPMWYTVHRAALQMECTAAVQDHILSWLYQNQGFIECYPGLVLRTAAEMKNVDLYRDAFAILVGKQLLGGNIEEAGVFSIDESIPPEAEEWRDNINAAKMSLQQRLEKLYSYIDSMVWLDNAELIPEYNKIAIHLKGKPSKLRAAVFNLDLAIRTEIRSRLSSLFAFSEDPGDPKWMNPWEKAMFDMMPVRKQIYSRMYWKQLFNMSPYNVIMSPEVETALSRWSEALLETEALVNEESQSTELRAANSDLVETAICLLSLSRESEGVVERTETRVTSSAPKDPTKPNWKAFRKRMSQNAACSRPSVLRPSKNIGTNTSFQSPPSANGEASARNYHHEHLTSGPRDGPPPYELHAPEVEKVGEKRKIRLPYPDGSHPDAWEIESPPKETEFIDFDSFLHATRSGRVEIENPVRKRRCSIERDISGPGGEEEIVPEAGSLSKGDTEVPLDLSKLKKVGLPKSIFGDSEIDLPPPLAPAIDGKGKGKKNNYQSESPMSEEYEVCGYGVSKECPHFDESMMFDPASDSDPELPIFQEASHWQDQQNQYPNTVWLDAPRSWSRTATWVDPRSGLTIARHVDMTSTVQPARETETSTMGQESPHISSTDILPDGRTPVPTTRENSPYWYNFGIPITAINMHQLKKEIGTYISGVGSTQLNIPISFEPLWAGDGQLIVSLGEEEWAFCPAWAGGMDTSGIPATTVDNTRIKGKIVELEVRGGISSSLPQGRESVENDNEEEYDDCATEVGSIGSFSTSGFSNFGVISDFDGESDSATVAGDDIQFEVETESLLGSDAEADSQSAAEAVDSSDSDDGFEEVAWEDEF